jgi:hypothetical protein
MSRRVQDDGRNAADSVPVRRRHRNRRLAGRQAVRQSGSLKVKGIECDHGRLRPAASSSGRRKSTKQTSDRQRPKKHQRDVIRWMDCAVALARRECGELTAHGTARLARPALRNQSSARNSARNSDSDSDGASARWIHLPGKLRHVISGEKDMCFRVTAAK